MQQIDEQAKNEGLNDEMGARQVELLTEMGWWSQANSSASQFAVQFPESGKNPKVAICRGKALRNLAYLALQGKNSELARKYAKDALTLDPQDKEAQYLLKKAGRTGR